MYRSGTDAFEPSERVAVPTSPVPTYAPPPPPSSLWERLGRAVLRLAAWAQRA